jgi:pimeloyl-ACP methyl ester carboxylesterase
MIDFLHELSHNNLDRAQNLLRGGNDMQWKQVQADDEVMLHYLVTGTGQESIVIANGLGVAWSFWQHFIEYFQDRYTIVTWDYRGLYRSSRPSASDRLSVAWHARDLKRIMAAEGLDRAICLGWSMGVQVVLEFYRLFPQCVQGLITVNGAFGSPFDHAFQCGFARFAIPPALQLLQRWGKLVGLLMKGSVGLPRLTIPALKLSHMISRNCPAGEFHDMLREYATLDFPVYFQILQELGRHRLDDLATIRVPLLVIASELDFLTPPQVAHEATKTIPGAEYCHIPLGSHYSPLEFPEFFQLRVEKFLNRLHGSRGGYPPASIR